MDKTTEFKENICYDSSKVEVYCNHEGINIMTKKSKTLIKTKSVLCAEPCTKYKLTIEACVFGSGTMKMVSYRSGDKVFSSEFSQGSSSKCLIVNSGCKNRLTVFLCLNGFCSCTRILVKRVIVEKIEDDVLTGPLGPTGPKGDIGPELYICPIKCITVKGSTGGSVEISSSTEGEPDPATLMIDKAPCKGSISDVSTDGTMVYNSTMMGREIDLYQYSMLYPDGRRRCITQFICQDGCSVPYINTGCIYNRVGIPDSPFDITQYVADGSDPTDYSTLVFKKVELFGASTRPSDEGNVCDPEVTCGVYNFPYTYPDNLIRDDGDDPDPYYTCGYTTVRNTSDYESNADNVCVISGSNSGNTTRTIYSFTHDNNGSMILTKTGFPTIFGDISFQSVKVTYSVSNECGESNDGIVYLAWGDAN